MNTKKFKNEVEDFLSQSLKNKNTRTMFLVASNGYSFTCRINGYPGDIAKALTEVLVDNPHLIKRIDGACRRARQIIKNNDKEA